MEQYIRLMNRCIELAKQAQGETSPNPMVGCVILNPEGEIISIGYHAKYGQNHAERDALLKLDSAENCTLVVNLEPCSHYGKTPPCADLIIKSGFKKVVIAQIDPNPLVKSKGVEKLKNAGLEVITGVLEKEALELNKVFNKNIISKMPYVMLKTATTLDGKIATSSGKSKWITNEKARNEVQKLRSEYQAIMSGSGTILKDNPRLNVRLKNKKSPIRIIFDPNNKISLDYNVFSDDNVRKILINNHKVNLLKDMEQLGFKDFKTLFSELFEKGIYSIMIEAGQGLNSELLRNGLVDEINQFVAPKIFGSGLGFVDKIETDEVNSAIKLEDIKIKTFDDNFLINGKIKNKI